MRMTTKLVAALIAAASVGSAHAEVSAEEAKQLGTVLTIWGAEKAGNKDGSIPAWTQQEKIPVPASYDPKDPGRLPDPWNDKPLYSITAQNMDEYAEHLTEGHKAMLKKYPTFRMDVYQTHRTVQYPKYVLDNTIKNATSCKAVKDELALEGCYGGVPFPIPKSAKQVMWNHLLQYNLYAWEEQNNAYMVTSEGKPILQAKGKITLQSEYYNPDNTAPATDATPYYMDRADFIEPARMNGQSMLFVQYLNMMNPGQRAWIYVPGQRRVKLAPDLAYDTPAPVTGGVSGLDESYGFYGPMDRYDFKLLGKKEVYLMYNTFKKTDYKVCPSNVYFMKGHVNPDCIRWEKHRVWVVEMTLKPSFRHTLPKRVLYIDEDTWGAATGVAYDASGSLYKVQEAYYYPYYTLGYGHSQENAIFYDLISGRYAEPVVQAAGAGAGGRVSTPKPLSFFTAESLAAEGIR